MHYVSVMKIRKIRELQLTNVRTLLIQVCLGPTVYIYRVSTAVYQIGPCINMDTRYRHRRDYSYMYVVYGR